MAESSSITLGYWPVRGLMAIPRLLCGYTDTPYTDKIYKNQEEWYAEKEILGFAFPNVPYLIDGDFKLTESRAIALYIIRRSGHNELLGKDAKETACQGMVSGVIEDGFMALINLGFNPKFETEKGAVYEAA
jgi:glutathione S-transferase